MGIYTLNNNKFIDDRINQYLQNIVSETLQIIDKKNIQAIVLTGSFGRGEGGVVLKNKTVIPINDFDISIVIKHKYFSIKKKYTKAINKLAIELANKIGIKQIDLGISPYNKFRIADFSVNTYEAVFGHKVLYGAINLEKHKKKYLNNPLPLSEGTKYLLTRGSGLIIPGLCFDFIENDKSIKQNFFIEMNKAALAIGDSFLIANNKYHFSYQHRLKIAQELNFNDVPNGSKLKIIYINALKVKLHPEFNWINVDKHKKEWLEFIKFYLEYFLWYESYRLNKHFISVLDYSIYVVETKNLSIAFLIKKFLLLFIKNKFKLADIKSIFYNNFTINLSMVTLLLDSAKNNLDNKTQLFQLSQLIKKYYNVNIDQNWEKMASHYLNRFHPEGFVKKITTLYEIKS